MLLTDAQIWQIRELVQLHHAAFVANYINPQAVAPQILETLKARGLLDPKATAVADAYLYGQLLAYLDNPMVQKMNWQQFQDYVKRNPVPLSEVERRAVDNAQHRAAQYVVGLGNRVDTQTGELLIEADDQLRRQLQTTIKDATSENIARRESVRKLKSALGWASEDWARDWDRIAVTEKHSAMQAGVRDTIRRSHGGKARVAKVPMPDACEHCKRLFLGPNGLPIVFELDKLEANGHNNVGRKATDWQPVIGPVHPHCQCQLVRVPDGWGFDETGAMIPDGEIGGVSGSEELARALALEDELHKGDHPHGRELRKITFQGIPIRVENEPGSIREGDSPDGEHWQTRMLYVYGYIERTEEAGADGEEVDVFVGPKADARMVYVIHQEDPDSGIYDEDKVMLGFPTEADARGAYQAHYARPMPYTLSRMAIDHFKRWVSGGKLPPRMTIPLAKARISPEEGAATVRVDSPSPGTSPNFIFRAPQRRIPSPNQAIRESLDSFSEPTPAPENLKRDPAEYEFREALTGFARPCKVPYLESGDAGPTETEIEANRHTVDREVRKRAENAQMANSYPDDEDAQENDNGKAQVDDGSEKSAPYRNP